MQKLLSFFQQKNSVLFCYKAVKPLTSWPLNELVKLTMLFEQPGPDKWRTTIVPQLCLIRYVIFINDYNSQNVYNNIKKKNDLLLKFIAH